MEKKRRFYNTSSSKAVKLDLIFIFCFNIISVQCLEKLSNNNSSDSDPPSQSEPPEFKNSLRRISLSILLGIIAGLIFALLVALLIRFFIRYINRSPILKGPVVFSPKIPPKTLKSALADEPQLLGSSPNGKYYKTVLDNGLTVAVKQLEPFENVSDEAQSKSVKRRIQQDLEILASLRHRNLMSLRAYIRESDRYSLIYDYAPTGSLEDAMRRVRENQLQLNWELCRRIAVGIVKGLQYLHFTCDPRRLHYNLKPSNVMLDSQFEPRLADFGLAMIIPNVGKAASGYSAPEYIQNDRYTDKSDVFSFGAILGVLLTGKDPLDPFLAEATSGGSLGLWLSRLQQAGEASEALDKSILREEIEEDEMLMAVKIAVVCLSDSPADRPSSDELVSMLTQLNSF
ncbi:inactive leucine-rich repeat receptor-like protein kinase CORYNE [Olea europaea var. sylvestris]|nr:inactive leucine-rich repeat receptor-like protein kinase CORYNE [Olea europaea var. sylvestris]XP_022881657.1 inactive leucine-rich repeat receptor-like protein kinase CORYNE [Olea europaea var. sylvestris]XP_022881658.1 inactive leucine-rich repeat receptor-like protein kinase CORYNE [Olea europaea var. sylvestris]